MAEMFTYTVAGERTAGIKFDQFPQEATKALEARMRGLTSKLLGNVVSRLPHRTGALAASAQAFVDVTDKGVTGKVKLLAGKDANAIKKALSLEYGAHSTFEVHIRPHLSIVGRFFGARNAVAATYQRTANIEGNHIMADALEALRPEITAELQAGLDEAAAVNA